MATANLVENKWLVRYPRKVEITYEQGGEFPDHEFKISWLNIHMVLRLSQIHPGIHRLPQSQREYIKY